MIQPAWLKPLQTKTHFCQWLSAAVVLFSSAFTLAASPQLFFRWGDESSTRRILQAGHYTALEGHNQDLSNGANAVFTQELFEVLKDWNKEGKDAAGTGLYASSDLFDSINYGGKQPHLLVLEALPGHNFHAYEGNWNVSNAPTDKILIRPPSAQDVESVWNQWKDNKDGQIFYRIHNVMVALKRNYDEKNFPRSTEIFLERLGFDHAVAYMEAQDGNTYESSYGTALKSTVGILLLRAPDHPALKKLLPLLQKKFPGVLGERP